MKPQIAPSAFPLYALGAIACLIAAFLFYQVSDFSRQEKWHAFSYLVFSIVLLISGVKAIKAAHNADKKYAEDMKARADTHAARVDFERHDVALETVREESRMEAMMRRMQQELEMLRTEAQRRMIPMEEETRFIQQRLAQREMKLREQYIEPARQKGISVDQFMTINEHWNREIADIQIRTKEMHRLIAGGLQSHEKIVRQKVYGQLFDELIEAVEQRQEVYDSHMDWEQKNAVLELYAARIMSILDNTDLGSVIQWDTYRKLETFLFNHRVEKVSNHRGSVTLTEMKEALENDGAGLVETGFKPPGIGTGALDTNRRTSYPATAGDGED